MPITAGISAAAGLAGAAISGSAAQSAAKTQAAAANQATNTQLDMFNQTKATLAPFVSAGSGAQSSLTKLLGIGAAPSAPMPQVGDANTDAWLKANPDVVSYYNQTPAAQTVSLADFAKNVASQQSDIRSPMPTYTAQDIANYQPPPDSQEAALQALPGYQFARDQGISSVNRVLGSMGQTGAQAKGIARFVTGLADQTYNSQVGNLQNNVNTGESAAAGQGNIGAATGANVANTIVGAGTAQAAGTVGAANAASGALGQIPSYLLANQILGNGGGSSSAGIYGVAPTAAGNAAVEGLY